VNLAERERAVAAALREAERQGLRVAVAVCDGGGHLTHLVRMDGASIIATESVVAKARTAVYFRRPTAETLESARRNEVVYSSILATADEKLVLSQGGVPLFDGDALVGAVAVAGATGAEDMTLAETAVEAATMSGE
jgi:uncharacterized protein GlcG (DUF336 family)